MKTINQTLILLFAALLSFPSQAPASSLVARDDSAFSLVKGEIDVGKENSVQTYQFVNRRKGSHAMGISFSKLPKGNSYGYIPTFEAEVSITAGANLVKRSYVSKTIGAFSGCYNKIGGFYLLRYKVPTDLPTGVPLTCTVKITRGDAGFESSYGKGEFFIIKETEK